MILFSPAVMLLVTIAAGSSPQVAKQTPAAGSPVVVFAAASTADAAQEIADRFRARYGGIVRISAASTSTLCRQIELGARADIFISAAQNWGDYLQDHGLSARRVDLLGNRLVGIVPADSTLPIDRPADLLDPAVRHVAVADTQSVPAGIYARKALEKLGLWKSLAGRVASGRDVRQTLAYVETGEAEAGLVYATDAAISHRVRVVFQVPAALTGPIRYPVLLLSSAKGKPAAEKFFRYLASPEAAEVFRRHGFTVLGGEGSSPPLVPREPLPAAAAGRRFAFFTPEEWTALWLSATVAVTAALALLPAAVILGYLLARSEFAGKWFVETLVNLPLVLPPVVTGYLLLICFGIHGPIGSLLNEWFGVRMVFTWSAAVLAAAVVSFPLSVRAIRLAFQSVDPRLEMAARGLGAGPLTAFFTVSLPLARRGIVAGWILAFARSLSEFGATIMVAGNIAGRTRTIPLAVFSAANRPGGIAEGWRLVILSLLLACAALVASEWLERRQHRHESA